MIDEAIGKILGMAMAYVASAMGMFVAYVNYRRRIVKADKVMTPVAWAVIAVTLLATLGGVLVVGQLAAERAGDEGPAFVEVVQEAMQPEQEAAEHRAERLALAEAASEAGAERPTWTWIGILIPASIFLFATVVTAGLHRHFSTHGH